MQFNFYTPEDIAALGSAKREWLVPGLLEKDTTTLLIGAPGAGKSFVAVDLACALTHNYPWLGLYSVERPYPVYYLSSENPSSITRRIMAWKSSHQNPQTLAPLKVTTEPSILNDDLRESQESLVEWMDQPGLLIIDTWSRALPGLNENSASDVSEIIRFLDLVRQATGCTILIVHHMTKSDGGARGSSALPGAVDMEFTLRKSAGGGETRELALTKNKDGMEGLLTALRIVPFEYNGDQVGQLIAHPASAYTAQ